MHLYNLVYRIHDMFTPTPQLPCPTADNDARLLLSISYGIEVIHARDGNKYWYYLMPDTERRDVVRYLLRRNGVTPSFHNSHYSYTCKTRPVFRVKQSVVDGNPAVKDFIAKVTTAQAIQDRNSVEQQVRQIKMQMKQRRK